MNLKNLLIFTSAFPYIAYFIYFIWSYSSGLERIGESSQGYFLLASIIILIVTSALSWGAIFLIAALKIKNFQPSYFIYIFISSNLMTWIIWSIYGLELQNLPFDNFN